MPKRWIDSHPELGPEAEARIARALSDASPEARSEGLHWYEVAHSEARNIVGDPVRGAGVLAALSPQNGWSANLQAARDLVRDPMARVHTAVQTGKALEILDGAPWPEVLKGPKERNFAANIADPADPVPVTIDRHAVRVALGPMPDAEAYKILGRAGVYEVLAEAYRAVARREGLLPQQVQAICWVQYRTQ